LTGAFGRRGRSARNAATLGSFPNVADLYGPLSGDFMALVLNKIVPDFEATATSEIKFSPKNYQGKNSSCIFTPRT
jgi:hypothetical protein